MKTCTEIVSKVSTYVAGGGFLLEHEVHVSNCA